MTQARIMRPAKTAMSSAVGRTLNWRLEFEQATPRRPDPLMGWIGSEDTLNQIGLSFETLEDAVAYAEKNGLDYTVVEPQNRKIKPKAYADNFRYDRVRT